MNAMPDKPRLVAANLVLLLAAGVAFCFWTIRFTDWFPVVGGLLGLTGAFAWIGFISSVIRDERRAAFQQWLDERVFQSHRTWVVVVALALVFLVAVMGRSAALVIDARGDDISRLITVKPAEGAGTTATLNSAPASELTTRLSTRLFTPRDYAVSATGLPTVIVAAHPLRREQFSMPGAAIAAPVVLVRLDPALSGIASSGEFHFTVTVNGQESGRLRNYRGTSVWLGTGRDVTVPRHAMDRWESEEIAPEAKAMVMRRWTTPEALADVVMEHGDELRVAVVDPTDDRVLGETCTSVTAPESYLEYPREVVIHDHSRCF
jgi:hypothetical protein